METSHSVFQVQTGDIWEGFDCSTPVDLGVIMCVLVLCLAFI